MMYGTIRVIFFLQNLAVIAPFPLFPQKIQSQRIFSTILLRTHYI